jgi:F-type H+-transporting ATPase subunit epsilon
MDFQGNNKMSLRIVTPEKVVYQSFADSISIPTESGEITILPHHVELVTLAKPGILTLRLDNKDNYFAVTRGVLQIGGDNSVTLLVTHSEMAEEIDLAQAEEAYERARVAMEQKSTLSDIDFARFQSSLERNLARIKTAKRRL